MTKIFLSLQYKYDGKSVIPLTKKQQNAKYEIISDFKKGVLKWERNKCRCASKNDLIISTKERYGFKLRLVFCKNCGLIRANPRISEDTIGIFYEKHYRNLISSRPDITNKTDLFSYTFDKEVIRGKKILDYIKKNTSLKKGVVFDFGAGTGGILKVFKDAGFETFGVDIAEDCLKYGLNEGLNLKKGSIKELKKYPKKANLIIASHILEHLPNLDKYLRELRECLKNKGFLYIEMPGLFNVQKPYGNLLSFFTIEHIYYFNLLTLRKILVNNGFNLVVGIEKINALFQKSSRKYDFKISKDYINNILMYLRIVDIPLPLKARNLIKNKRKLKNKLILKAIDILFKTKAINLLALTKELLKQKFINLINKKIIFKLRNLKF